MSSATYDIASHNTKGVINTPLLKGETKKMKQLRERRERSTLRRARLQYLDSPERQAEVLEQLRQQNSSTPVEEVADNISKKFESPYAKSRTVRKISQESMKKGIESFNRIFDRPNSTY